MTFNIGEYLEYTESRLVEYCDKYFYSESQVNSAARYSLLNAGKRVRAILIYMTAEMCGQNWKDYAPFACGVEMIHCYSLIHDDLPCMDNDDYRRGKPACHKAFPENIALLAGDALLGCGIKVISNIKTLPCDKVLLAVQSLCKAIGPKGMIYGQELDLKFANIPADKEQLKLIHRNKTGQLISLCGTLGSINSNLEDYQKQAIDLFFANTGLVFQIVDDILDVEGSEEQLGKPIGSDCQNNKSTFVKLYGMENSKLQVTKLTEEGNQALMNAFKDNSAKLIEFTKYLSNRKN